METPVVPIAAKGILDSIDAFSHVEDFLFLVRIIAWFVAISDRCCNNAKNRLEQSIE
jgi:hypothetical protein